MGWLDKFVSQRGAKLNVEKRFDLLRSAVSGTMSRFYMARDRKTGETVGLKILDPEKTAFFEARFRGLKKPSEGEIASQFDHPRIVKTLEYGLTTNNEHYLIMQYLPGPGLNILIKERSPLLAANRLALIRQMAEALAVVHAAGYIHRDICPRNFICLADASELKLIDFGPITWPRKSYGVVRRTSGWTFFRSASPATSSVPVNFHGPRRTPAAKRPCCTIHAPPCHCWRFGPTCIRGWQS